MDTELDAALDALTRIAQHLEIDRPDARPAELAAYIIDEIDRISRTPKHAFQWPVFNSPDVVLGEAKNWHFKNEDGSHLREPRGSGFVTVSKVPNGPYRGKVLGFEFPDAITHSGSWFDICRQVAEKLEAYGYVEVAPIMKNEKP